MRCFRLTRHNVWSFLVCQAPGIQSRDFVEKFAQNRWGYDPQKSFLIRGGLITTWLWKANRFFWSQIGFIIEDWTLLVHSGIGLSIVHTSLNISRIAMVQGTDCKKVAALMCEQQHYTIYSLFISNIQWLLFPISCKDSAVCGVPLYWFWIVISRCDGGITKQLSFNWSKRFLVNNRKVSLKWVKWNPLQPNTNRAHIRLLYAFNEQIYITTRVARNIVLLEYSIDSIITITVKQSTQINLIDCPFLL